MQAFKRYYEKLLNTVLLIFAKERTSYNLWHSFSYITDGVNFVVV